MTPSLRESFEAWHKTICMYPEHEHQGALDHKGEWYYLDQRTDDRWHAWQASAASMAEQAAKVADDRADLSYGKLGWPATDAEAPRLENACQAEARWIATKIRSLVP